MVGRRGGTPWVWWVWEAGGGSWEALGGAWPHHGPTRTRTHALAHRTHGAPFGLRAPPRAQCLPRRATYCLISAAPIGPLLEACGLRLDHEVPVGQSDRRGRPLCVVSLARVAAVAADTAHTAGSAGAVEAAEAAARGADGAGRGGKGGVGGALAAVDTGAAPRAAGAAPRESQLPVEVMAGGGLRGDAASGGVRAPLAGDEIAVQCRDGGGRRVWWAARVVSADVDVEGEQGTAEGAGERWRQCVCGLEWRTPAAVLPAKLVLQPHAGPNWRREEPGVW